MDHDNTLEFTCNLLNCQPPFLIHHRRRQRPGLEVPLNSAQPLTGDVNALVGHVVALRPPALLPSVPVCVRHVLRRVVVQTHKVHGAPQRLPLLRAEAGHAAARPLPHGCGVVSTEDGVQKPAVEERGGVG